MFRIRSFAAAALAVALLAVPARAELGVTETSVHVQVDGAVRRPGVYAVRRGARVAEAIAAAGGPRPGARLLALNLAKAVADGERCHVPAAGEAVPEAPPVPKAGMGRARKAAKAAASPARRVRLNHATAADLDTLPGVGPAMATRILAVRQRLGRFRAVEDLREVPGIGAKRLAKLAPLVEVD